MIAKITITIILIIFFSSSTIAFLNLVKNFRKKDKTLIFIVFISAVFSGYALFEFIKMII